MKNPLRYQLSEYDCTGITGSFPSGALSGMNKRPMRSVPQLLAESVLQHFGIKVEIRRNQRNCVRAHWKFKIVEDSSLIIE